MGATQPTSAAFPAHGRIRALDWLRGLSVIFMIECHALIYLDPQFHATPLLGLLQQVNGLVCASFLFTAGFAGGLVGSRGAGDRATRRRRTKRTWLRLAQVLAMSLYFHWIWNPLKADPVTIFRVDILLCIAIGVAAVWAAVTLCRGRQAITIAVLLGGALAVLLITPWAWRYRRGAIATELLNGTTGSMFPLCPWLLFPLLGAAFGVIATHPTLGRRRLTVALLALAIVAFILCRPVVSLHLWPNLFTDVGQYWAVNVLERIWKLSLLIITLLAIESAARFSWTSFCTPIERTVDYFSRHALSAYIVHLSLLYGFLNYQFTQQWHGRSTWMQYTWRMLLVIAFTALICQAIHRGRRVVEAGLRKLLTARNPTQNQKLPLRSPQN